MSIEEFDKTSWRGGDAVFFDGEIFPVASVDFDEKLIGIIREIENDPDQITWKRCENCDKVEAGG